jgi:hypothetical protein
MHPMLKFLEEGGKAQGQEDRRQGITLSHPYTRDGCYLFNSS